MGLSHWILLIRGCCVQSQSVVSIMLLTAMHSYLHVQLRFTMAKVMAQMMQSSLGATMLMDLMPRCGP